MQCVYSVLLWYTLPCHAMPCHAVPCWDRPSRAVQCCKEQSAGRLAGDDIRAALPSCAVLWPSRGVTMPPLCFTVVSALVTRCRQPNRPTGALVPAIREVTWTAERTCRRPTHPGSQAKSAYVGLDLTRDLVTVTLAVSLD